MHLSTIIRAACISRDQWYKRLTRGSDKPGRSPAIRQQERMFMNQAIARADALEAENARLREALAGKVTQQ
jgi:hypothetical protein